MDVLPAVSRAVSAARRAWLVGNVYEGVVDVPRLIGEGRAPAGALGPGSPARFFLPLLPAVVAGSAVDLTGRVRAGESSGRMRAAGTALAGAVLLSGYLIRTVNLPLLRGTRRREREVLIRRWHRVNAVRVVLLLATEVLTRRR